MDNYELDLLCHGIPKEILSYDKYKLQTVVGRMTRDTVVEIKDVELTGEYRVPFRVTYIAATIRYFASKEDAEKAEKDENCFAGRIKADRFHTIVHSIRYSATAPLTMELAKNCVTFKRF